MGGGAHLGKPCSLATGAPGIICTGLHTRTHKEALPNGYNLELSSRLPQRPAPLTPENTGETATIQNSSLAMVPYPVHTKAQGWLPGCCTHVKSWNMVLCGHGCLICTAEVTLLYCRTVG